MKWRGFLLRESLCVRVCLRESARECVSVCVSGLGGRRVAGTSGIWLTVWLQLHTWAPPHVQTNTKCHTHEHTRRSDPAVSCDWTCTHGCFQSAETSLWAYLHVPRGIDCVRLNGFICVSPGNMFLCCNSLQYFLFLYMQFTFCCILSKLLFFCIVKNINCRVSHNVANLFTLMQGSFLLDGCLCWQRSEPKKERQAAN